MATRVTEGNVGFAGSGDELVFPSVTSCLTVTCITKAGGKWGAHMSMFPEQGGKPYNEVLPELSRQMSKDAASVEAVWVVGVLDTWTRELRPVGDLADGPKILKTPASNQGTAATAIKTALGLKHLDAGKFKFQMSNTGDVTFSSGANPASVKVGFKVEASDESKWKA